MGKQKQLKAQRREARQKKKFWDAIQEEERKKTLQKHLVSPPDLGVSVSEEIQTADKFGG